MNNNTRPIKFDDFYSMLADNVRMNAYKRAIDDTIKEGDTVIDLGAGTGILGLLALKAGAKKVIMIEKSDAIDLAKAIVQKNGYTNQVEFIQKNSLDVTIDEKVDVIVSETLGNFGLDENTLEFIIDARTRFLKKNGKLIPEAINLYLAPVESKADYEKLAFWKNIEGIDFTPAHELFSSKMMITTINPKHLLSIPVSYGFINFHTVEDTIAYNRTYHAIERKGTIYGVAGWFDLILREKNMISTSPISPTTHWKQVFFPMKEPISVMKNDLLELTMLIQGGEDHSDNVKIKYEYRCTQRS